jgi:hypothetical protein
MQTESKNRRATSHHHFQTSAQSSAVRAEMVARGRALIADPNYPSNEQMKKVAGVLAAKWQNGTLQPDMVGQRRTMDIVPAANSSMRCRSCVPTRSGRLDIAS